MNILLFGPPGAGKGTQSTLLKERLGMVHISTGDLFRAAIKNKTPLGMEAQKYLDAGQLVPDTVTIGMVEEVLAKLGKQGFILDGFPRNQLQAEALDGLLGKLKLRLEKALFLDVPASYLVERLTGRRVCSQCGTTYHVAASRPKKEGICDKCGGQVVQRKDDQKDVIEDRLKIYEQNTAPLKQYYTRRNLFEKVDGRGDTEEVFGRIEALVR